LIIGSIATLRYEVAILLPKTSDVAWHLFILSVVISLVVGSVALIVLFVIWQTDYRTSVPSIFIYFLPIGIILFGIFNSCQYWLNRNNQYKRIAIGNVVQTVFMSVLQMYLGYHRNYPLPPNGLIVGRVLGLLVSTAYMVICTLKSLDSFYKISVAQLIAAAKKYKQYATRSAPGILLNSLANNIEVIAVSAFFGLFAGGIFGLATRIADMPKALLATSIWQVFVGSKINKTDEDIYSSMSKAQERLLNISLLPALSIIFIPEDIFEIIFGDRWENIGLYIGIYVVGVHINTIASSFSLFVIKNRPDAELIFNALLVTAKLLALILGIVVFDNLLATIILLTISRFLMFFCLGGWNYGLLGKSRFLLARMYISELLRISPFLIAILCSKIFFDLQPIFLVFILGAINLLYFYLFRAKFLNEKR
jgi:O-antigen/teichoic acid export membrane protein